MDLIPSTADETILAKTEYKLIGILKPHKGHTCYEMNLATKTIKPAVFEEVNTSYPLNAPNARFKNPKAVVKKKLIIQPDCIYCTALNTKNALKRFIQMLTLHHARTHHSQPE